MTFAPGWWYSVSTSIRSSRSPPTRPTRGDLSRCAPSVPVWEDGQPGRRSLPVATWARLTALATATEKDAPLKGRDGLKIAKLETFLVQPRWLFLKVHTNARIVGLGEPIVEGRALTVQAAVKEIEPYLIGKDPRQVVHHWQAIYRHAFYRGGPVLTSALSGIDQALWDIKGKA